MAKLPNYLCVFDLETSNVNAETTAEPIQIAIKFFDYYSLDEVPNGEWSQICCPEHPELIDPESLKVHKIPLETILAAPKLSLVWDEFVKQVQRFNPSKGKYLAPVVAGYNIEGFDLKIVNRMNARYYGDKTPVIFNEFRGAIDLMKIIQLLFDTSSELTDNKFDTVRKYFGITDKNAHNAQIDVRQEGALLVRLIKYMRQMARTSYCKFKGSFKDFDFGTVSY